MRETGAFVDGSPSPEATRLLRTLCFFLSRSNLHLKDDPTTPEIETPIAFQAAITNLPFTTPNHLNCLLNKNKQISSNRKTRSNEHTT